MSRERRRRRFDPVLDIPKHIPNAWTALWYEHYQKYLEEHNPLFSVQTSIGKTIELNAEKNSRWDFHSKYITTDCPSCPLHVPPEGAREIARQALSHKGRCKINPPLFEDIQGVCLFTGPENMIRRQFLIENPHNPSAGCPMGDTQIQERYEQRKKELEIK